jgi:hypothetical protein
MASNTTLVPQLARGINLVSTTVTRPGDTTPYGASDAIANSTSAPTTGGFTLSNVVTAVGRHTELLDLLVVSSNPLGGLSGLVLIFSGAVTAVNDNAVFSITTANALTLLGAVPFTTVALGGTASVGGPGLRLGIPTTNSANLRFLLKTTAAYTPTSSETITVIAKFRGIN